MSCSGWVDRISGMLDGSLTKEELRELNEHLSACAGCRAELLLQKKIEAALGAEMHNGLPADFTEKVAGMAIEMSRTQRRPRPWLVLVPPLATATAVVSLFFLGLDIAGTHPSVFQSTAEAFTKPIAAVFQAVAGLIGEAAELGSLRVFSLGRISGPTVSLIVSALIGIIPAAWSVRRILVFMRR